MTPAHALLRHARALAFDFDGTLVDSNPVKWRAFERCFTEFPERLDEIVAYCRGHHAIPRGEKFRHVYERILGLPYSEDVAAGLDRRFAALTTEQIVAAPEIPGADRFLRSVSGGRLTALLSTTPHQTLLAIVAGRGWSELFAAVEGAPVAKGEWLRGWRERRGLAAEELVFFGDTVEDATAAAAAGCPFVAVGPDVPPELCRHRLTDFEELLGER